LKIVIKIEFLNRAIVDYIGFSMGVFGLLVCMVAQLQMGNAWRVGIDRKNKAELIRTGLYRLIRNPTYAGLFILSTGVWLIFPTMSFMLWGLTFYISLEFQVRLEEEF